MESHCASAGDRPILHCYVVLAEWCKAKRGKRGGDILELGAEGMPGEGGETTNDARSGAEIAHCLPIGSYSSHSGTAEVLLPWAAQDWTVKSVDF